MTARRPDRTLVVLCVLLALAVAALLALLTRDFLLPRFASAPAAPPSAASSPASSTPTALPSPTPPSPSPPTEAPGEVPTPAEVADAVEPGLAAAPGTVSAQFRDLATGRVLFSQDAEEPVAPASAVKILTGAAVLDALGPDAALPTRVVALPAEDGEATELVLVGGGDVLLGTGASDPSRVDGRAGLRTLAERTLAGLAERGVTGPVVVSTDLRLFEDEDPLNPAWSAGMVESGNIAAVQPLAAYGGRATPGTGQDRVVDPAASAARAFQAELDALAEAAAQEGDDGALTSDPAPVEVALREEVPATHASRQAVRAAEPVAEVRSAPVAEQVAYLLAHSENQVAEALAHTAAAAAGRPPTHAGAAALLEQEAAELGVDPTGLDVVDASGLAAANRLSADQLVGVVTGLAADPARALVLGALPSPGEDSTLGERFPSPPARDAVAAKTGTLDQTVSLTGTVTTTSGRVLAFSVVCSGVDWQIAPARAAIDEAVAAVAAL